MTIEDRLRAAIERRTTHVEPSPDGLRLIEERLMESERHDSRNRWLIGVGAAAAVVALVVGAVVLSSDDDPQVDTAGTPSTTTTSSTTTSTTTAEATTTTTTAVTTVDPETTVFPDPLTSRRFESPEPLVHAFATELLGYSSPVLGELQQGDARSGEIDLRPRPDGAVTTVLVRQMEDSTWFVLGAVADSIQLTTPAPGATITSPTALAGAASAFEGTVDVRLYADGTADPIGQTFVTGRGDGELGDFAGELSFEVPAGAEHGVLVLSEASGEDGSTVAATVIRVHF